VQFREKFPHQETDKKKQIEAKQSKRQLHRPGHLDVRLVVFAIDLSYRIQRTAKRLRNHAACLSLLQDVLKNRADAVQG
jgi:hypothetical protein